jgi:GPH family glycoside/pentoside/hexuronide:cation symporter
MDLSDTKLSFREKVGYSLGDTASHFVWDMVGFWLLFFYTDVYGISAAAAGTIMLVARFWDMAIDPVIGVVSDRTNTRWGKFRPYILFAAIPYAILAISQFVPNAVQSDTAITGIKLLVSVIPVILYMSCAIFMLFYKIDSKTTDLMKKELGALREKENQLEEII